MNATSTGRNKHYAKEAKSRKPVTEEHAIIAGVIRVLEDQGGGPLTSVAIFRRGVELGVFEPHEYDTVRARLSQHCDLDAARVVRAKGSKIGVQGSRTTGWVLAETGLGVQRVEDGLLVLRRAVLRRRRAARVRRAERERATVRNLILTDATLANGPEALRAVAGRTAREALVSVLPTDAACWLIKRLPLEASLRERLLVVAHDHEARAVVIEGEERRRERDRVSA